MPRVLTTASLWGSLLRPHTGPTPHTFHLHPCFSRVPLRGCVAPCRCLYLVNQQSDAQADTGSLAPRTHFFLFFLAVFEVFFCVSTPVSSSFSLNSFVKMQMEEWSLSLCVSWGMTVREEEGCILHIKIKIAILPPPQKLGVGEGTVGMV